MPDRSRCPNCGERVTPYAAGCAICGADLDPRRWDSGPTALTRISSWVSALSFGRERRGIGLLLLVLLFGGGSFAAAVAGLFS